VAGGNNWWVSTNDNYQGASGGTTVGGGGGGFTAARDALDRKRMGSTPIPGADYPDGYLGTITDRNEDKLYGTLQKRLNDRSYQRGVHKGEKIGRDSYYWTPEVNPDAGLALQAQSAVQDGNTISTQRWTSSGNPVERLAHQGRTAGLTPPEQMKMARQYGVDPAKNPMPMTMTDPTRAARIARSLPPWSGVNVAQ
jgi:hypothetical protein